MYGQSSVVSSKERYGHNAQEGTKKLFLNTTKTQVKEQKDQGERELTCNELPMSGILHVVCI